MELSIVATGRRVPRAEARRAVTELLAAVAVSHDVGAAREVLVMVRATSAMTVADINAITDALVDALHPDASLEVDASADLEGADDVELSLALPGS